MSNFIKVIYDDKVDQVFVLSKEILQDSLLQLNIQEIKLTENFENNTAVLNAKCLELFNKKINKKSIQATGVGLVDACFNAIVSAYGDKYSSLSSISIADFVLNAHLDAGNQRKSDAYVTALLRVKNANNFEYSFQATSLSVSKSCVVVLQECIAFFINAEEAFKRLHFALKDAQERSRSDLIERYKNQMSTLVNATSYENLISKLNNN